MNVNKYKLHYTCTPYTGQGFFLSILFIYLFICLFIFEGGGGGIKLYMNIKFFPFGTLFAFILFILPVVYANKVKLL